MSLLQQIQGFSKSGLKPTETVVTTPAGQKFTERHDETGRVTQTSMPGGGALGFVGDYKPDLQVGIVLPRLCIGTVHFH